MQHQYTFNKATMMAFTKYLFLFLWLQNVNGRVRIDPLVESKVGLIRGLRADDGTYSMFMGIPYATVDPTNPFGPSVPHKGFDEAFEAYDDSAICPQIEEFNNTNVGTLDCLHLNIYVPNSATSKNRLPVLAWIYGGGFSIGYSGRYLYGPKFFVQHDVILVTLNYRLGPYGFMCLDNPKVPGNQGLKDQQLALKWIKENIEAFGGDPNKITIFGESAGSVSVGMQLLYNKERLFDKIIMQSGNALTYQAVKDPDNLAPFKLAEYLGFETSDVDDALSFLATVDTKLVIAAATEIGFNLRPCVENEFDGVERFIDKHPLNVKLPYKNIPVLAGYNSDEYLGFMPELLGTDLPPSHDSYFTTFLENAFDFDEETLAEMKRLVKNFYVGDEELNEKSAFDVIEFGSDFHFIHPTYDTIRSLRKNDVTVYHYVFSYVGGRNFVKMRHNITVGEAAHADEIGYQFDISYMGEPSDEDQLVIDRMSTLWTNFAKYGNPTPETSELIPVKWQPVTDEVLYYMDIGSELTLGKRPIHRRMAFWDLFYKMNEKYIKGYSDYS